MRMHGITVGEEKKQDIQLQSYEIQLSQIYHPNLNPPHAQVHYN